MKEETKLEVASPPNLAGELQPRRRFLKIAGAALAALPFAGCAAMTSGRGRGIDLGSGDIGVMNYALTLEGLEAEFYTLVVQHPYAGMSREEAHILRDIRDHEIVHREFFRRTLGRNAIPPLEYDFSRVDFNDRLSVLTTARTFEDLGVAAYNGAGHAVKDPRILGVAGKIVSVEARHAAAIRDLIEPDTEAFAPTPLDRADGPSSVLKQADPYILTKVDGSRLPDR